MPTALAALLVLVASMAFGQDARSTAILPPLPPWEGRSRALALPASDPWVTPSEAAAFRTTPSYEETVAWLRKLVAASPQLRMVSIGKSGQGRDIWLVIASKERAFTPEALRRTGKPTLFAQGGIHSGEIDGKDAGLMLLRDLTIRGNKSALLDRANLLFVPIFSVDAHERTSAFNRVNQRGPENMGWRTTPRNLNLNRDFMKADTPEMQAMIRALDTWKPDLYIDLPVTDGADYQYDITYGWNNANGFSPRVNGWLESRFKPAVTRGLADAGHVPGELVFPVAGNDVAAGIGLGNSDPRFSNAYADARHVAGVLVENHSLKPYDQRVLGTYIFLDQALRVLGADGNLLRQAREEDTAAARRSATVPLSWRVPKGDPPVIDFLGVEARPTISPVSGDVRWEWTGKPVAMRVPVFAATEVATTVTRPRAYWVPAEWSEVIDKLALHGVQFERFPAAREAELMMYRVENPKLAETAFEGRVRVTARPVAERRKERFAAGSIRVPTDQPLGTLAVLLLEPTSPDSLFQWGFMHSILNPTEYIEGYIVEPMAERMLAEDPKLAAEFRKKLAADAEFRGNARARLQWFYRLTPFYDVRARLYPIAREE